MIPLAWITRWRSQAPWPTDAQVEQDLVLSRALVELYHDPLLSTGLAFRGGTALHKLFLATAGRYSEDIDLVQVAPGAIGPLLDAVRHRLDPWLGPASWKLGEGRATLVYRFETTSLPTQRMRLKVEINTREHGSVHGLRQATFAVESPWFSGAAELTTYELDELLATKLRALYQRRKGRDLYDLWQSLRTLLVNDQRVVATFEEYLRRSGAVITRRLFEDNLDQKLGDPGFSWDVRALLVDPEDYDASAAAKLLRERLLVRLSESR